MQCNTLNLHTPLTFGVGLKGQLLKLCRCKCIFFYQTKHENIHDRGLFDLNDTEGELGLFVLLLYVPSQQLWSLRDGQFTYPHFFPGQA